MALYLIRLFLCLTAAATSEERDRKKKGVTTTLKPTHISMQSILGMPQTNKYSILLEDDKVRVGASSMQGWRSSMEDAHHISLVLPNLPRGHRPWEGALFCVFDGHGGSKVAQQSANSVLDWLTTNEHFSKGDWAEALVATFLRGDAEMNRTMASEQSGCTANAVMMIGSKLLCANAGDSRAVLCRNGVAVALSEDHKPTDEKEKQRIDKAGGFVANGRVNGILSLSRALGDYSFKSAGVAAPEQVVTAFPDVTETDLDESDEFVIIACDGIWDCMTNEQAVQFVRAEFSQHGDAALACEHVMTKCLATHPTKFGTDNMTVIVVEFKNLFLNTLERMRKSTVDLGALEEAELDT